MRAHQLACGAAVAAVALLITAVAMLSTNGAPGAAGYRLVATLPADAPVIRTGVDVRVAGRYGGKVTAVRRTADNRQAVTMQLRVSPVGANARATVRLRSAAGQFYIALQRGDHVGQPLPSGAALASGNVRAFEDLPTVVADFGRRALRDQGSSFRLVGTGLLGNGEGLNRAGDGLGTTLARTTGIIRAVAPDGVLPRLIRQSGVTLDGLRGRRPDDAGRLVTSAADTFDALGDPRSRLDGVLRALPPAERSIQTVLPTLDPLLARASVLARRLRPGARALREALPSVQRLLASRPTLAREVAPLARSGVAALRALAPVLRRLGPSAVLLGDALEPLGRLADHVRRYPKELEAGAMGYYAAYLYHAPVGAAAGSPAAPAMLIFTCASGLNADPKPGDWLNERLDRPCR